MRKRGYALLKKPRLRTVSVPVNRLPNLPAGTDAFLDAIVFIYAFSGHSNECHNLLRRCSTEKVCGITTLEVINEVTHRLMLAETMTKGIIKKGNGSALKGKWRDVAKLTEYWILKERIFGLNILITGSARLSVFLRHVRSRPGLTAELDNTNVLQRVKRHRINKR